MLSAATSALRFAKQHYASRISQGLVLAVLATLSACGREQSNAALTTAMQECTTAQIGDVAIANMSGSFVDSLSMSLAQTEVMEKGVAFASPRYNEVVLTDRDFTTRLVIGRRGGGPGDLSAPQSVRATQNGIAILEGGNQRVSFWTWNGEFLHSVRVGSTSKTFEVDAENHVFSPSNQPTTYVLETANSNVSRSWGERIESTDASRPSSFFFDMVALAPDGTLFVFDNRLRLIVRVPRDGDAQQAFGLPASIEATIESEIARTDESFTEMGMSGHTAALRAFRMTDEGKLFIRTIGDGPFAMIVNPADMSCTALTLPADSSARAAVKGAYSMMIADSTLYVASAVGHVLEFALAQ